MRANLFILTVLSLLLFSCKSESDTLISVQLNPTFLTFSEGNNEPMKMKSATVDTVQVYAVQVYENDAPFYYGLFTDVSKMQIALTTSKTYKFKIAAYKAGTGKGLKTLTDADGVNYYLPTKLAIKNAFIKGDLLKDIDSPTTLNLNSQQKDFAEVDAFYATKSVTVEKGTSIIDFSLLRMGYGINFSVDALTSGNMEIYLGNDTIKLNSTKTTATTVRQFNKTTNNFTDIHSKAETFGDSIAISAKWTGTNGTTVTASGKYKFLRNYQKTINIQLNTLTNSVSFEGWVGNRVTTLITDTLKLSPITVGGVANSDGSSVYTERGILYGLTSNLTISNSTLIGSFQYGLSGGGFDTPSTGNGKITSGSGNGTFSAIITHLLNNKTYYIRAYAVNSSGTFYGEVLKFNTKNYTRDLRRFDVSNVFWQWGSQYTLFDLQTDEIINPNSNGNYDIWYSTNENPKVFQTTLTSGSYNTCYKFKTLANCQRWCDIHNGVLKP